MIVARAHDAGCTHTAPEMVSLLMQVDLDDRIPPQLYQAVADLLAWLYSLDRTDPAPDAAAPRFAAAAALNGAAPRDFLRMPP